MTQKVEKIPLKELEAFISANKEKTVIVHFSAEWCGSCKYQEKTLVKFI